jgi:hypothetical protein
MIQSLGDTEVLSIFDQVKTKGRACHTQSAKVIVTGAVVHYNQALHLRKDVGQVIKYCGAGSIRNYHGADMLRCHFRGSP